MNTAIDAPVGIALEHVFDYHALLKPPVVVGRGPAGTRIFYEALRGRVEGPVVNGDVLTGGGDWAIVGPDGWTRVDVRGQCRTDDDAVLFLSYRGLIEPTEAFTRAVMGDGETAYGDQYWRVAIEVETGDPRYDWLTRSVLVGRGRICRGDDGTQGAAYEVFRVG